MHPHHLTALRAAAILAGVYGWIGAWTLALVAIARKVNT